MERMLTLIFLSLSIVFNLYGQTRVALEVATDQSDFGPPPECFFRLAVDEENIGRVVCSDNSLYHPNSWQWHFGDGQGSSEDDTEHQYTESGVYEICLTVSNESGSDTDCQEVVIEGLTSTRLPQKKPEVTLLVYPNPARGSLVISSLEPLDGIFELVSLHGGKTWHLSPISITSLNQRLDLQGIPAGTYWLKGKTKRGERFAEQFILL